MTKNIETFVPKYSVDYYLGFGIWQFPLKSGNGSIIVHAGDKVKTFHAHYITSNEKINPLKDATSFDANGHVGTWIGGDIAAERAIAAGFALSLGSNPKVIHGKDKDGNDISYIILQGDTEISANELYDIGRKQDLDKQKAKAQEKTTAKANKTRELNKKIEIAEDVLFNANEKYDKAVGIFQEAYNLQINTDKNNDELYSKVQQKVITAYKKLEIAIEEVKLAGINLNNLKIELEEHKS